MRNITENCKSPLTCVSVSSSSPTCIVKLINSDCCQVATTSQSKKNWNKISYNNLQNTSTLLGENSSLVQLNQSNLPTYEEVCSDKKLQKSFKKDCLKRKQIHKKRLNFNEISQCSLTSNNDNLLATVLEPQQQVNGFQQTQTGLSFIN